MKLLLRFIIIFNCIIWTQQSNDFDLTDEDYKQLPPLFHIDRYDNCTKGKTKFCTLSIQLTPLNTTTPSKFWKLIEQTKNSTKLYSHDILSHAICVQQKTHEYTDNDVLIDTIEEKFTNQYKNYGLSSKITDLVCDKAEYSPNSFDFLLICFLVFYGILLVVSSFSQKKLFQNNTLNKVISSFSLRQNFSKILKTYNQAPYGKLTCIQSIRFYTTTIIIFAHTLFSFCVGYIENTTYVENAWQNVSTYGIIQSFTFLVQIYFLISGWILSYNTFKIFEKDIKINLYKWAFLTIFNRYLRLIPIVLIMVSLAKSVWFYKILTGPVADIYASELYKNCQKNWWITLFFISNHLNNDQMCLPHLWYLAADTQLYVLSLVGLIFILKSNRKMLTMIVFLMISIGINCVITHLYSFDIIFRSTPELSRNFLSSPLPETFNTLYTSFHTNMTTYILGLIFGYVFFCLEDKNLVLDKILVAIYWVFSLSLCIVTVIISCYTYGPLCSAILSGLLKPSFALGIGLAILGISLGIEESVKQVFEWKPTVFLGNLTYSTYVTHISIMFARLITLSVPFKLSDYVLQTSFIQDLCLSFFVGFIVHLIFEMPLAQLQNCFIPKFRISGKEKKLVEKKIN